MVQMTQALLKKHLSYDPETGLFTRVMKSAQRTVVGEVADCKCDRYVRLRVAGVALYAHRLAWLYMTGAFPEAEIDHIDGNGFNNKWSNLREATRSENTCNTRIRSNNASGFKGVSFHKATGKWQARCGLNNKSHYLGVFDTAELASDAYTAAAKEQFGAFFKETKEPKNG